MITSSLLKEIRQNVPLFCTLMVIGLVWAVVFYLTNNTYPIPGIGFWNLAIAFGFGTSPSRSASSWSGSC